MKMSLTISRNSNDEVTISVQDGASRSRFLELHMTPAEFGMAVTGMGFVPVEGIVRDLHTIGREKVIEHRSLHCPVRSHDRAILRAWLEENGKEDGWTVDSYLGSQNSVTYKAGGGCTLNYSVYRYEAPETQENKA